jgi:DNA-directed RNA polymerase subunit RPC12/RpoP
VVEMVKITRCILCGRKLKIDGKDAERLENHIDLKSEYVCLDCRRSLIFNPILYKVLVDKIKEENKKPKVDKNE